MSTTYSQLMEGVAQYYGAGSDPWLQVAQYGVNADTLKYIEQVPGVSIFRSTSGKYLGYDYKIPFQGTTNPLGTVNSNVPNGAYGTSSYELSIPGNVVVDSQSTETVIESGATAVSTGSKVAAVAGTIGAAVGGVALGSKLGAGFFRLLYAADPDYWDRVYPTVNPEVWDDMCNTNAGKYIMRALYGLEGDNTQMYLPTDMLAYTYATLLSQNAFAQYDESAANPGGHPEIAGYPNDLVLSDFHFGVNIKEGELFTNQDCTIVSGHAYICAYTDEDGEGHCNIFSDEPFSYTRTTVFVNRDPITVRYDITTPFTTTLNGTPFYYSSGLNVVWDILTDSSKGMYQVIPPSAIISDETIAVATIVLDGTKTPSGRPQGIEHNPYSSITIDPSQIINPTTGLPVTPQDGVDDIIAALKNRYPDITDGEIEVEVMQADGTKTKIKYVPVPYPDMSDETKPITNIKPGVDPVTDTEVNPQNTPEDLIQKLVDTIAKIGTDDTTAPDTGTGDTPVVVIPEGSAHALYSIYNPTQSELNSFGSWLWSSNFVEQIKKLFNDPMQSIIGLHKVFCTPPTSGRANITVGYLDSGVAANLVSGQYVTINCGEITLREFFGNVFDYDPFTQVYIYLPFIGIQKLDTGDVMRGVIKVIYHVDVLTGACLAEVSVRRDGSGGVLYTYSGNCAVQYPLSSGSYMGIFASIVSIAGGIAGTIASGGAAAPMALGAISGAMNAHTRVQHSGSFAGNAGAMGSKKPYLIITRPQTALSNNFPNFEGFPANQDTTLSTCTGFVKCRECHLENIPATDPELSEIENMLKTGIII